MTRRKAARRAAPFVVVNNTPIAVDYRTTQQYGGRVGLTNIALQACFFSVGEPGACHHYVVNLPPHIEHLTDAEVLEWISKNFKMCQHIRTCETVT
jgi:hypothetical protein